MKNRHRLPKAPLLPILAAVSLICSCAAPVAEDSGKLRVVTTTGVLADLASRVAGDAAHVTSLVPAGADPGTYEPSLRDIRDIAYADVAFTNYLLLEQQSLIRSVDANLRAGAPSVALAEAAMEHAAEVIPRVETANLDTVWLGLRVDGDGLDRGADRSSEIRLKATSLDGPGTVFAYLTGTFGGIEPYFDSSDGFDAGNGFRDDTVVLPPDAHTHTSWAFSEPGVYRLTLQAELVPTPTAQPVPLGTGTLVLAVGVNPHGALPEGDTTAILSAGHADLTVDLSPDGGLHLLAEEDGHGASSHEPLALDTTVVAVPNKALTEIPPAPEFRRLGASGEQIHQLPQAVLSKHVHGEIDPHLWHDVRNAEAYVRTIRDVLTGADPENAAAYRKNTELYLKELDGLHAEVTAIVNEIPPAQRNLVTTYDAFAYLGRAYDITIAGFMTPGPAAEPSLADRQRLSETVRNLDVPAVFLEPQLAARSNILAEIAKDAGIGICPLYSDAFDETVTSYSELMRFNAASLRNCLS
ncbi:anchored repeat ABC transporter, substrate-binding protein [Arthrobacter frigidicola]|nr:anchored repeat ABC transporter, substrate-binding protein [Arthrobacter frigidicola]